MKNGPAIFFVLMLCFLGVSEVSLAAAQSQPSDVTSALNDFGRMTAGQKNEVIGSMGFSSGLSDLSMVKIIAWVLFGAIGFGVFIYGKKERSIKPLVVGIALMGYPYFVNGTFWLYAVGAGLCLLLYFWRD